MISVKLIGGLGNQMFQYSFISALSQRNNLDFCLETKIYQNRFKRGVKNLIKFIVYSFKLGVRDALKKVRQNKRQYDLRYFKLDKTVKKVHSAKLPEIQEKKSSSFDPDIIIAPDNFTYSGYFQSEKYFRDFENSIRADFKLEEKYQKKLPLNIREEINSSASVSLHVRRGDYVTIKKINDYRGTCSSNYYQKAISLIKEKEPQARFFIFSDDITWCQKNLDLPANSFFVRGLKNYQDLILMSYCKHNIIANSTFSWWGAWLNDNKNKVVIAPKDWLNVDVATPDLIPSSWITI